MITAQDYAGQQAQLRAACAEVARIKAASRPIAQQDGPPAPRWTATGACASTRPGPRAAGSGTAGAPSTGGRCEPGPMAGMGGRLHL